ncbi:hypothetical protein HPB50_027759 [Hyalomma asiaticum]|nr:hypothetical protein HPB50_027759 [Hyalomma asiaticum]
MASMQFTCEACSMQFNGPVTYKGHLESARHQTKVAVQKQLALLSIGGATGKKHQRALENRRLLQLRATLEAAQPLPLATVVPRTPPTPPVSQPPQEQLAQKAEQKDEVIYLSCRFSGIVLFEDIVSKLEHLETEAHRKKKGLPL